MLGLVTTGSMTGNAPIYRRHPDYLRACGVYHRQWLARRKPRVAVLMGAWHLAAYRAVWMEVWPDLFGSDGVWHELTVKEAYVSGRTEATAESGLCVRLVYHPASWQWWDCRPSFSKIPDD